MLATIVLLGLLLVAATTDLLYRKIHNWTTYSGILAGLALGAAGLGCDEAIGLRESLIGFLTCGFLMLVMFVMLGVGGGDVKLLAMLGAFLGVEEGITAMLWTFVLGACMGLIVLIWRVGPYRAASSAVRLFLLKLGLGHLGPLSEEERAELKPPLFLAPNALVAVAIVRFVPPEWLLMT